MTPHKHLKVALLSLALFLGQGGSATAQEAAATTQAPRAQGAGPALWVVRDADSTLYLFGTIHLLRPTTAWSSERLDHAFNSASRLILEVASPGDRATLLPLIRQYGISPDRPLSGLLTTAELAALDAAARTIGSSAAQMDSMRPWLVGVTIQSASIVRAGYDPESGVDPILKARAEAAGMTVSGFETPEDQIRMLSGFPEEGQLTYLRRSLDQFGNAQTEFDTLVEAWAKGDVATIATVGVVPLRDTPVLYDAVLVRRNTNWADQIQTLLEGSGTVFIAVGTLHLTGDDSVQAILRSRGVVVESVPDAP